MRPTFTNHPMQRHAPLRRLLSARPFTWIALLLISFGHAVGRIASYVRARALFPQSRDVICHWSTEVKYPENITLGQRVIIGTECTIGAKAPIFIGDDVLFSKGVFVDTGSSDITSPPPYPKQSKPIRIERGVWLGAYSVVLAGVTIGENSVVSAGTVVRKSVPPGSLVVGERCKVQSFLQDGVDIRFRQASALADRSTEEDR
jgi:acetyltransferase-like isoleucine patch superfamily enzyme